MIKKLSELLTENEPRPSQEWQVKAVIHEECLSYLVWNEEFQEGLIIDPKKDELKTYLSIVQGLPNILWLGVIDTHTHADHISAAADIAYALNVPLIMHHASPSKKVQLRVSHRAALPSRSGPIHFILTPGHTPDGICVNWGSFVFTGDTILYGDVGRDDLPFGDAASHYESLQLLKSQISKNYLIFPGHDTQGGRVISWGMQLKINSSLTQLKSDYVSESLTFDAPGPILLKKALFENFK